MNQQIFHFFKGNQEFIATEKKKKREDVICWSMSKFIIMCKKIGCLRSLSDDY